MPTAIQVTINKFVDLNGFLSLLNLSLSSETYSSRLLQLEQKGLRDLRVLRIELCSAHVVVTSTSITVAENRIILIGSYFIFSILS